MTREVSADGITWSCIQAFAGLGNDRDKAKYAQDMASGSRLRVVCTPSGGAKSVALELEEGWESVPDEVLVAAIHEQLGDAGSP